MRPTHGKGALTTVPRLLHTEGANWMIPYLPGRGARVRVIAFLISTLLLLAACSSEPSPAPTSTPEPSSAALAAAPSPMPTSEAAFTPTATATATPTPTPGFTPGPVIMPTVAMPTPAPGSAAGETLSETLDIIGSRAALLRGLFSLRPMEREFINQDELFVHLREEFDKDRDFFDQVQELYATLGILDKGVSLYDLLLGILSEDVLGFFDTEKEKLFVVGDAPEFGPRDAVTYVHEFVHGLQQQHFDIHSTSESLEDNTDRFRAFRGLVEGDATVAQTLYLIQNLNHEEQAALDQAASEGEPGFFESAPHVIQRMVVFPYVEGTQFVIALFLATNNWDFINLAFENLPASTEQILHPLKYVDVEVPTVVELSDLTAVLGDGWTLLRQDTLGEFVLLAYLESSLSDEEASLAAAGWGGDSYALLKGPQDQNLLASLINWDSENDAKEFFDAFLDFMRARSDVEWTAIGDDAMTQVLNLPDQNIYINLDMADTLLIYAPDPITLEAARAALKGE